MDMKALNFLTTRDAGWAREKLRVFLLLWFVLSYVQGVFSGLNEDEPYYYMYAMFPAWGYFDHPPMVGMFAWAGIQMFGKVLGLRLFSAISSTLFLYAVWKLIEHKDKYKYVNVFILMVLSIPMVSVYGFMIVPDGPLLFFVSLFLLAYRWFLKSENVLKAILVGVLGGRRVVQQVPRSAGVAAGGGLQRETAARPLFLRRGPYGLGAAGAPHHLAGGTRFSFAVLSLVRTYGR